MIIVSVKSMIFLVFLITAARAADKEAWFPLEEEKIEVATRIDWRKVWQLRSRLTTYQLLEDYLKEIKDNKRTCLMPHVTRHYAQELIALYGIDLGLDPFQKSSYHRPEQQAMSEGMKLIASVGCPVLFNLLASGLRDEIIIPWGETLIPFAISLIGVMNIFWSFKESNACRCTLVSALRKKQQELIALGKADELYRRYSDFDAVYENIKQCKSKKYPIL